MSVEQIQIQALLASAAEVGAEADTLSHMKNDLSLGSLDKQG